MSFPKLLSFLLLAVPMLYNSITAQVPQTPKPATLGTYPGATNTRTNSANPHTIIQQHPLLQYQTTQQRNQALINEAMPN